MQIGVGTARAVENKRVFVVDDDEIARAALQFMLHDENETHELASVQETFAKAAERKPDLVLLGLGIVRGSGLGVVTEILERIPGVKILLVAESEQEPRALAAVRQGAHGIIAKPLRVEPVRRKVDVALARRVEVTVPLAVLSSR
jgi:DNA-binding NtrC family response regulator